MKDRLNANCRNRPRRDGIELQKNGLETGDGKSVEIVLAADETQIEHESCLTRSAFLIALWAR